MKISILTLFPEMFSGPFDHSIIKRAIENKIIEVKFVNIRDFGIGKHKIVDDTPYGGGKGMVLRVDVLEKAINKAKIKNSKQKIILLSAHGKQFNQAIAKEFSNLDNLILICGHYEGFDERIKDYIDGEISVGDYILTGGEIPAMLITDTVARLAKGVIKDESSADESFSSNLLEYPQYTKPATYKENNVPEVLLSGNHAKINSWRKAQSIKTTQKLRPDLIEKVND